MLVCLAPAGRNIYSHGITKPEAPSERHENGYAAPLGFSAFVSVAITMSLLRNSLRSALMANNLKRIQFSHFFAVKEESFFHGTARRGWVSAPPELEIGRSAAARTAALIQWQWGQGEGGPSSRLNSYG